jgi:periplasmic protein TonB
MRSSNSGSERLQQPPTIPTTIGQFDRQPVAASPDIDGIGVEASTGSRGLGAWDSTGTAIDVAPQVATPAVAARPLKVSHWAEGNLIFRVQPIYPPLARQARVQGSVLLRAVVSKAGTIENLVVMSGHPMLVKSAMEAVRQWRYRPYRLNNDPVEVETEITVNFVLAGG